MGQTFGAVHSILLRRRQRETRDPQEVDDPVQERLRVAAKIVVQGGKHVLVAEHPVPGFEICTVAARLQKLGIVDESLLEVPGHESIRPLDAIERYQPLDWISEDAHHAPSRHDFRYALAGLW